MFSTLYSVHKSFHLQCLQSYLISVNNVLQFYRQRSYIYLNFFLWHLLFGMLLQIFCIFLKLNFLIVNGIQNYNLFFYIDHVSSFLAKVVYESCFTIEAFGFYNYPVISLANNIIFLFLSLYILFLLLAYCSDQLLNRRVLMDIFVSFPVSWGSIFVCLFHCHVCYLLQVLYKYKLQIRKV